MSKHRGLPSDNQDDERAETATPDPWAQYVSVSTTLRPRPVNPFVYISFNCVFATYIWLIDHWIKVQ